MRYRPFGKTELKVSEIAFGCGDTAGLMVRGTPEERVQVVARAIELGITYFDTAPAYGDGLSEQHLGQALRELGVRPIVATKVVLRGDDFDDPRSAVLRSMERSLERLSVARVDIVHLHNRLATTRAPGAAVGAGPPATLEEVLGPIAEAFESLKARDRVTYVGLCAFGGEMPVLKQAIKQGEFDSLMVYYNVLNPTAARPAPPGFSGDDYLQVMNDAAERGMAVAALRVLAAGALTDQPEGHPLASARRKASDEYRRDLEEVEAIRFLAEAADGSLAQGAIRFALMNQHVSTVLVGISSLQQLETAAACSDMPELPAEVLRRVERAVLGVA